MSPQTKIMDKMTIRIGSKEMVIETTPLFVFAANFRSVTLVQPNQNRLLIKPRKFWQFISLIALFSFIFLVYVTITGSDKDYFGGPILGCALLAFFLLVTLVMLWKEKRFDFNLVRGEYTVSNIFCWRKKYQLKDILAIQLIDVQHPGDIDQGPYTSYQLNLVIDDDTTPRINLMDHTHLDSILQTGKQLTDFLRVPFIDHR